MTEPHWQGAGSDGETFRSMDGQVARVRPRRRLRNRAADSLRESGMQWLSGRARRQRARALQVAMLRIWSEQMEGADVCPETGEAGLDEGLL